MGYRDSRYRRRATHEQVSEVPEICERPCTSDELFNWTPETLTDVSAEHN